MHVIFLNPQGNFDQNDSHMTEHPDFGGQLIYVKELCEALSATGTKVDIVTRRIIDPDWPEFSNTLDYYDDFPGNPRIVRIACGGTGFLDKELLWEHLDEFTDNILEFYGRSLPHFATAHYGDGGYCGLLLQTKAGMGFTFTAHSLGAQKIDKIGTTLSNIETMEHRFRFSRRIAAERLSMTHAYRIITSTYQERFDQFSHALYREAVDVSDDNKFIAIPPGVNAKIFNPEGSGRDTPVHELITEKTGGDNKPFIVLSSRLVKKKNHIGTVKAFASSERLKQQCNLGILLRGIDDPYSEIEKLHEDEQVLLRPVLEHIEREKIRDKVFFFNIKSQHELAATYRYFAKRGSVFSLTAFYEPFGLAPVEAAACGLAVVATKNGGQSEVFGDGSGVLIDPSDERDIREGLLKGLADHEYYARQGGLRVKEKYTWDKAAAAYLSVIRKGAERSYQRNIPLSPLDASDRMIKYLSEK